MGARLTRKEQQARTRSTLLQSASRVLACKGLHRASIDDITADAGFTKGAFYANFRSKDELFLVMLDEHFAERLAAVERITAEQGGLVEQARRAGDEFTDALRGDEEWCRLFLEFASHASRHEDFRRAFVERSRRLRDGIAAIFARRAAEAGIELPVPPQTLAQMTFAMGHGVAVEQLLDPDGTPADLFGRMLELSFAGIASGAPAATGRRG
jgi:AcrR family transcriptional regulator